MPTLSPLSQRIATDPAFAKFSKDSSSLYNQLVDIQRQLSGMSSTSAKPSPYDARYNTGDRPMPQYGPTAPGANVDPTIAGSSVRRYTAGANVESPAEKASREYYEGLNRNAPDEGEIRRKQREGAQSLIDSITSYYSGEIAKKQEEGRGITGAARASAARSGTLGQDFGIAEVAKGQELADSRVRAVEAERNAQVAAILMDVENRAQEKIEAEKTKAETNTKEYLTYLEGNQTKARSNALNLAKLGKSISDLNDKEYNALLEQTGYSPEELEAQFIINKPEDKVLTSFTQGNKYYVVTQDPVTGKRKTESVDLGFDVPKEWSSTKLDDGIMFYNPKNPKENYIYNVAPSAKDAADLYGKQLDNQIKEQELLGGGKGAYKFTNEDKGKLINANFTEADMKAIEADVREHGVEQVLAGITDPKQKAAITEVLQGKAATPKVTKEQVRQAIDFGDKAVSPEDVAAQMKNKYTNDELEQMTLDAGYAWVRPVTDSDIADFLASPEARSKYAELLYEQYKAAGLAAE